VDIVGTPNIKDKDMPPKNEELPPDKDKIWVHPDVLKRIGDKIKEYKKEPTIQELAIEGGKLLEADEKQKRSGKQKSNDLTQKQKSQSELTQADRYQMAHYQVLNDLPQWKKNVIEECIKTGKDDRLYSEFAKAVIRIAESSK
jgi:hypothetical protein